MTSTQTSDIGQYRIVKKLGEGGMGSVYLGEHKVLGKKAAIKTIIASNAESEEAVHRLMDEGKALASLGHPNIVDVFDFFTVGENHYLVMEFVEGESLDQRIKRGPIGFDEAMSIALKVGTGIAAAHARNILHRDIKPANVMLREDGAVKVMDFGLAKFSGASTKTRTGYVVGTPRYMSPEQVRGQAVDASTDQYAFAVLVYRLLCGREPFVEGDSMAIMFKQVNDPPPPMTQWNPGIPPGVEQVVLRGMGKTPAERWPDVAAMCAALQQAVGGATFPATARLESLPASLNPAEPATQVVRTPPSAPVSPSGAPVSKSGALTLGLIALLVIGGVGGGGWFVWKRVAGGSPSDPAAESAPLSAKADAEARKQESDTRVIDTAFEAINAGEPQTAVDSLRAAGLEQQPGEGRKLYVTALAALESWDAITELFGDADPATVQGAGPTELFQLGVAWQNKRNNDFAAAAFQKSYERNMALPADKRNLDLAFSAKQNLALALLASGRPEQAEPHLRALVGLDPKRSAAWFLLGEILKNRGDKTGARAAYEKAAETSDDAARKADYQGRADALK